MNRLLSLLSSLAAIVVAVLAVVESETVRNWAQDQGIITGEVSNGDLLTGVQLLILLFVLREVRRIQMALMSGRGVPGIGERDGSRRVD